MSDPRIQMRKVHEQLLEIRAQTGTLTPEAVVDAARDEASVLHSRFEWDNTLAGERYRRIQAAELIRSVTVVYAESPQGDERKVRAWSSVGDKAYRPTEEVVRDEFAHKLLIRGLEREIKALQRKYGHLEEFAALILAAGQESA